MSQPQDREDPDSETEDRSKVDKAKLAAIFGEVLPETTSDERDPGRSDDGGSDAWLRAQVPPHHG